MLSIAAVERDTGLSKDTLRIWERRYGFPTPERDALGERSYPMPQVERLRAIRRLLDVGHRPGRVVALDDDELGRLSSAVGAPPNARAASPAPPQAAPDLSAFMAAIAAPDAHALRGALGLALARLGLGRFVLDVVAPLNVQVGEAWMQGRLTVMHEHLYTESVQTLLRHALYPLSPAAAGRPRVLLATAPGEPHGLGLLMAEAMLALEGCHCVSLGVQTPVVEIARAANALRSDVVALSYTGCGNPNQMAEGLADLRDKLPRRIDLWAGGAAPLLQRRTPSGARALPRLEDVAKALADWRARHAGGA